jgi:hypothetical protein
MMKKERERKRAREEQSEKMRTKGLLGFQWWFLVVRKRHINVVRVKEKKIDLR